jgi:hypothetical protein
MFCPECRVEYRPGFARCSDCGADLVADLPPPRIPSVSELTENERPDLASTSYFLAWFMPMCIWFVLLFGVWARPFLLGNIRFMLFYVPFLFASSFGSFWMVNQALRHEKRAGKYFVLSFVPFLFIWYSIVRVPLRKEFQGNSDFVR